MSFAVQRRRQRAVRWAQVHRRGALLLALQVHICEDTLKLLYRLYGLCRCLYLYKCTHLFSQRCARWCRSSDRFVNIAFISHIIMFGLFDANIHVVLVITSVLVEIVHKKCFLWGSSLFYSFVRSTPKWFVLFIVLMLMMFVLLYIHYTYIV